MRRFARVSVVVAARCGVVCGVVCAVAGAAGCTPAPVAAFERFYGAMAARDAAAFRAQLCPASQALVAGLSDEDLKKDLQVTRVVSRITVKSEDPATKTAVVDVEDATGAHELVTLREVDGGWCVELQQEPPQKEPAP